MKKILLTFLSIILLPMQFVTAAETPQVVVSIKPIHSLVSGVMEGVATPTLLVKKGSPHAYTLRPSEASALANADLVIWVGHEMESFLEKPLETVAGNAQKLTLSEQLASSLLTTRTGTEWEDEHDHSEHDHAAHEGEHEHDEEHAAHEGEHDHDEEHAAHEGDHDHDEEHAAHEDDHDHDEDHAAHEGEHDHDEEHAAHEGEHAHEAGHHHGAMDLHLWLDPKIAQKIVIESAKKLIEIDPEHSLQYQKNADNLTARLMTLDQQLAEKVAPVKAVPYLAFHSAYQYFETAYGLNAVGSVTIDPDRKPGAKGISEIRQRVKEAGAKAVFSEPQFESSLVQTIIEGTGATTGILDPLGSDIEQGPEAYFTLLNNLTDNLVAGLK
ncbi:zinc ABC transporter substrate-binding protein [Psychromonas aquatilis]|uniref:High-affinity zinc uptake system protein ZnuA n=1 Tax=Psychromonas aquatilis TaxID=2005072 RepID=A0ABU9GLN9_9GAMM